MTHPVYLVDHENPCRRCGGTGEECEPHDKRITYTCDLCHGTGSHSVCLVPDVATDLRDSAPIAAE